MDFKPQDIRDYQLMASVRRRRESSLRSRLAEADTEHDRSLRAQLERRRDLEQHQELQTAYTAQTQRRTVSGNPVRLADLQGARAHTDHLAALSQQAVDTLQAATLAVAAAADACAQLRHEIAVNDAAAAALESQAERWKMRLAQAAEEREEDERADSRPTPRSVGSPVSAARRNLTSSHP